MKVLLRNLWSIVRRFRLAMFLNIAGLAVAFAAFAVILAQVHYERSFDRCHPTAERIFRINQEDSTLFSSVLPRGMVEEVSLSSPHIRAGSLLFPYLPQIYFTVEREGMKQGFREPVATCQAALPQIFDFPIIEGDAHCLEDPEKVMIPESMARRMFGTASAVGKTLRGEEKIWSRNEGPENFTVGAVYRDFPGNTQMKNEIYMTIDPQYNKQNDNSYYRTCNYIGYLLLDDAANAADVADNFNRHTDFSKYWNDAPIYLTPLTDIYYLDEGQDGSLFRSGNRDRTNLLIAIALLIILVAVINYTNFSTALTPLRIRSVNTQKVLGSTDASLRVALLGEAVLISLVAWLASLGIVWMLEELHALPFVKADLSVAANWQLFLLTGVLAASTGLVAGLYPAWYVTSFPPALALKGSFGLSPAGRRLRTVLVGIQYVISILLIISAGFISLQNSYMHRFSQGFDKGRIAIVELNSELYTRHRDTYVEQLKNYPGIQDVAFAMEEVGASDNYSTNSDTFKGENISYFSIYCSYNFLDVMGIPVIEGRDFMKSDETTQNISFIFNRAAQRACQLEIGSSTGRGGHIIGFTGDVKFSSLRRAEDDLAFLVGNWGFPLPFTYSYIRLKRGSDPFAATEQIRKVLAALDPTYPVTVKFYDELFNQLYQQEENFQKLILLFSLLAILLSLVGVFGLVVFDTQYRRKEIGIRRVMGASVDSILLMFNRSYLKIVVACFVIAAPLAWYGVYRWLENFSYKTPIYGWVFALALLVVALITVATVTFQSWRAANANPVDSIQHS